MAICGIKVRMAGSSTAMNGAKFQCCELPIHVSTVSPSTASPLNYTTSLSPLATEPTLPLNSRPARIRGNTHRIGHQ